MRVAPDAVASAPEPFLSLRAKSLFDRFHPLGLGKRKKRTLHRVALIAEPQIDDGRQEQVKLWVVEAASPHSSVRRLAVVHISRKAD
jgi:hypothetical protein